MLEALISRYGFAALLVIVLGGIALVLLFAIMNAMGIIGGDKKQERWPQPIRELGNETSHVLRNIKQRLT